MAKYLPLPKSLQEADKTFVQDAIEATEVNFRELFGEVNRPLSESYTTSDGKYHWSSNRDLLIYITDLTGTGDIRAANTALYQTLSKVPEYTSTMTGAPEYSVSSTTPNASLREQQEAERVKREAAEKQTVEESKKQVETSIETAIKRQQEIFANEAKRAKETEKLVEEEKTYVKAQKEEAVKTEKIEKLREQAKANPQETVAQVEKTIKERVPTAPDAAAKQTAYDIVQNLQTNGEPLKQTAIISAIAASPKIIDTTIKNEPVARNIKDWTTVLSDKNLTSEELSRALTEAAFGTAFRKEVLPNYVISFSGVKLEGYQEYGFAQIPKEYSILMDRQGSFLDGLKGFSEREVRAQISSKVNLFIAGQIKNLPADSALRGIYSSEIVQTCLPLVGMGVPGAWQAVEGSFFGKIAVGSGFAPVLGWLGEKTGIDFGIKKVAQVAIEKGVEGATGIGLAASITAAFAWTGPLAPVIGAIGAFIIETIGAEVVNKVVKFVKDNAQKYGKFIVAGVGAVFGLILGGGSVLGGILGAGVGYFGASLAAGGTAGLAASASAFGSGLAGVAGAIGGAFLGAIGIPILSALLGIPLIVIFILFIINSGAYVVPQEPPSAGTVGGAFKVVCTKDKGPVGIPGVTSPNSSSPIANRAWEITYDLYQGFWCFWNRSPKAPPPWDVEFPNDTITYLPSYPELFDYASYFKNPNPSESSGPNLFWCTDLVLKSYQESKHSVPNELGVASMYDKWPGKIIKAADATPQNILPGSAVFFQVTSGEYANQLNHVGIVYSVDQSGIWDIESNNAVKSERITFLHAGSGSCTPLCLKNATAQDCGCYNNAKGVGNLPGMLVNSFGLP